MQETEAIQPVHQYLSFFLGGDEYAVRIVHVREIIECTSLTRVPGAPAWIRGVLNLRGLVVPVVDLSVKFGLTPEKITRRSCVVILELRFEDGPAVIGIIADAVHQVLDLAPDAIQPPPSFGPKVRVDCILGMGDSNGKFVVLLDIDRILSSSEIVAAADAAQADALQEPAPQQVAVEGGQVSVV